MIYTVLVYSVLFSGLISRIKDRGGSVWNWKLYLQFIIEQNVVSEIIYKHITSTFRIVSGIILSRLHLQLESNGVVIKDIPITGITARVP